ncbi:TolC family protein, partial [Pseudomonas sp. MOB-449]|nr:TolC family protein [Pseudomonas sp. MOB-449]
ATVGVTDWELDLFGRLRSLNQAALEQYFATEQARRSTQIGLVASVADAWLRLQADRELLALSEETLRTYEQSLALTQRSFDVGVASALELS